MSEVQAESGSGAAPPSGSEVCSEEDSEPSRGRLRAFIIKTYYAHLRGGGTLGNVVKMYPNSCQVLIMY